jgi:hypothetical protein
MKQNLILFILLLNFKIFAQQSNLKQANKSGESFNNVIVRYRVTIVDTNKISTINSYTPDLWAHDYKNQTILNYMDPLSFNYLIRNIKYLAKNNNAIVYKENNKLTRNEINNIIYKCDSIQSELVDEVGNSYVVTQYFCDSTSVLKNIIAIDFIEKWEIIPGSSEFVKKVLAYIPLSYNTEENSCKELFTIYVDEKSRHFLKSIAINN